MTGEDLLNDVRRAWADVLGTDVGAVPLDTPFFDAGGNSLLQLLLWEQLDAMAGGGLRAEHLFRHNTVRAQVAFLGTGDQAAGSPGATATRRDA